MLMLLPFLAGLLGIAGDADVKPVAGQVTVWLNIFIPGEIPGYTKKIPDGAPVNAGLSVIPPPSADVVSGCFMTDQRTFDVRVAARKQSRGSHAVIVDFGAKTITSAPDNPAAFATHEVDCTTGEVKCDKTAPKDEMILDGVNFTVQPNNRLTASFRLHGAIKNPCFPIIGSIVPTIDWDLPIKVEARPDSSDVLVSVNGMIDKFPAFELVAMASGGDPQDVCHEPVPPGGTVNDLYSPGGMNMRAMIGSKVFSCLPSRSLQSTDPRGRFTIRFTSTGAELTELNESRVSLTRTVTMTVANGVITLERPNDDAVLKHLEFKDAALRAQILAAGPKPSRITLDLRSNPPSAEWLGLAVKKKGPNNVFDGLIQPGDKPPTKFEFKFPTPP